MTKPSLHSELITLRDSSKDIEVRRIARRSLRRLEAFSKRLATNSTGLSSSCYLVIMRVPDRRDEVVACFVTLTGAEAFLDAVAIYEKKAVGTEPTDFYENHPVAKILRKRHCIADLDGAQYRTRESTLVAEKLV